MVSVTGSGAPKVWERFSKPSVLMFVDAATNLSEISRKIACAKRCGVSGVVLQDLTGNRQRLLDTYDKIRKCHHRWWVGLKVSESLSIFDSYPEDVSGLWIHNFASMTDTETRLLQRWRTSRTILIGEITEHLPEDSIPDLCKKSLSLLDMMVMSITDVSRPTKTGTHKQDGKRIAAATKSLGMHPLALAVMGTFALEELPFLRREYHIRTLLIPFLNDRVHLKEIVLKWGNGKSKAA